MTLSEKERLTLFSLSTPRSGPQLTRSFGLVRGAMHYAVLFKLEVLGLITSERLDITGVRLYSLTDVGRRRMYDELERRLTPPPVARVHRDGVARWLARLVWGHR